LPVEKASIVGALGRGQSCTLLVKKEAMAPCTYVRLSHGVAPDGLICFGSLKFTNTNRPMPAFNLLPGQALRFRDLDFIADHLG